MTGHQKRQFDLVITCPTFYFVSDNTTTIQYFVSDNNTTIENDPVCSADDKHCREQRG